MTAVERWMEITSYLYFIRLDFIAFSIASPDAAALSTAGQCLTDVFTVSGQSNPVPSICGNNANQHSNESLFF